MSDAVSRITKNSVFLYIRMIALMVITLYTSRVVLNSLGVEDYGIVGVVGSLTATFVTLRTVFSEAIQRFLNYAKGQNDDEGANQVFNIGIILHLVLVILFIVMAETIGLWLVENKLEFPADRFSAARYVYQFTILSGIFLVLLIPFDAVIIANEKMGTYAWVSIFDGIARLVAALLISVMPMDHLVGYTFLLSMIPLCNLIFYFVYTKKFKECKLTFTFNREKFKEIAGFAGWSFAGNLVFTLSHEGVNIILNMFGGVIVNAARNIAYQVRNAVNQIANNTILAAKPFVVQKAAVSSKEEILRNITTITRLSFFLILALSMPVVSFCKPLLTLWLGDYPSETVYFTQLIIISVIVRTIHGPLNLLYMAFGKVKRMSIIESVLLIIMISVIYLLLSLKATIIIAFIIQALFEGFIVCALALNIKYEFQLEVTSYFKNALLPSLYSFILLCIVALIPMKYMVDLISPWYSLLVIAAEVMINSLLLYVLFLKNKEKEIVMRFTNKILKKI